MTRLPLPAMVDLPAAIRLADLLRATKGPLVLDAAAVERIGGAGLQLLLSAQATARGSGTDFAIEHPSAALCAAARTAGADRLLASDR
jgi:anti-anti-sigma regulatory factor